MKSGKKPKTKTTDVIRRSLRTRGMTPESKGLEEKNLDDFDSSDPIAMKDALYGDKSEKSLIEAILGMVWI